MFRVDLSMAEESISDRLLLSDIGKMGRHIMIFHKHRASVTQVGIMPNPSYQYD